MTRKLGWFLLAAALAVPSAASAQPGAGQGAAGSSASPPQTEDQARAQQHFQRAKELYQAGSYRDAINELEAARALDPKAKELVFNLGIVHEKLARFDEAIGYFQKYLEMEGVTPAERAKAESIIKRIEGAKREVPVTNGTGAPPPPPGPNEAFQSGEQPVKPAEEPPRGRIDAATIAAAAVGLAGLAAGTGFGIAAVATEPKSSFVTGRDGTYAKLKADTDDAHTLAIVADVGFVVGVAGAAVAAILYFGRTRDREAPSPTLAPAKESKPRFFHVTPSAALVPGGAALSAGGTF